MATFGVTAGGFVPKGFDVVLAESMDRARAAFGAAVDLSPTSPLRKILEVTAAEDALLWRRLEDLYYSRFLSAAVGDDLDLLGEDLGVTRRFLHSAGEVTLTVGNAPQDRVYDVPVGAVVVTAGSPPLAFHTTAAARLSAAAPTATVGATAFVAGPTGDVRAGAITAVDPVYAQFHLTITAPATLTVSNPLPFTGGTSRESDEDYRERLIGHPRTLWTLAAVRAAAREVPGVVDVLLSDPVGGVDVSQSFFGLFTFGQRQFSGQRRLGEPYFFDVVVAHEAARPWRTQGAVTGIFEQVTAALDRVRPVGVFANVREADHIEVGMRAQVLVRAGYDTQALFTAFLARIRADVGLLGLGGDVLYSRVMRAIVDQPGVLDVQNLHLRRRPTSSAGELVEAGAGENLPMGPREVAVFRLGSDLSDVELIAQ
ncbi:baseplate J/gp47 family protein [Actinomycetes bacterium KLBMP 9797]